MDWNKVREDRPAFAGLEGKTPEAAFGRLGTPCYILDKAALRRNGEILKGVQDRTGCRVLFCTFLYFCIHQLTKRLFTAFPVVHSAEIRQYLF